MDVGFIGTGRMGTAMARNLLKAGHRVRVWDVSPEARERIRKDGGEIASSAEDAFCGEATISMLPNDDAMRETFIASGILAKRGAPIPSTRLPPRSTARVSLPQRTRPMASAMSQRLSMADRKWRPSAISTCSLRAIRR